MAGRRRALVVWRSGAGPLIARFTSAGGTTSERSLGTGSDVRLIAGAPRPVLLVTDPGGGHRLLRFSPADGEWSTIAAALSRGDLTTAALSRGLIYLPVGTGRRAAVLATGAAGRIVARLPLPVLEPDPSTLVTAPGAPIAVARPGCGSVSAPRRRRRHAGRDLDGPGGRRDRPAHPRDCLAFQLHGVVAATVGGDGFVYLLAERSDPAFTLRFLRIAVHPLRVLWADTGADPGLRRYGTGQRFWRRLLRAWGARLADASSATSLWLIDATGARREGAVAHRTSGLRMGPGRGDSGLLYGWSSGSAVTRFATATGRSAGRTPG